MVNFCGANMLDKSRSIEYKQSPLELAVLILTKPSLASISDARAAKFHSTIDKLVVTKSDVATVEIQFHNPLKPEAELDTNILRLFSVGARSQ
jgi:hypothetical protein